MKVKPFFKGRIAEIIAEYVADQQLCEECVDRVIAEAEEEDLFIVIGDAELANTVKITFGDSALVTLSESPEPDTLLFQPASPANLAGHKERLRKQAKFLALRAAFEDKLGRDLTEEEMPQSLIDLLTK